MFESMVTDHRIEGSRFEWQPGGIGLNEVRAGTSALSAQIRPDRCEPETGGVKAPKPATKIQHPGIQRQMIEYFMHYPPVYWNGSSLETNFSGQGNFCGGRSLPYDMIFGHQAERSAMQR